MEQTAEIAAPKVKRPKKDELPAVSVYHTLLEEMRDKHLVLFVPTTSRGLKHDYPELGDANRSPEFVGIGKSDMLFIWSWACVSSPFCEIEDRPTKLRLCCKYAYPIDKVEQKQMEYALLFPESIANGIAKMGRYNLVARIEEYLAIRIARNNYKMVLSQDITKAGAKARKEWLDQSIVAQRGLEEQRLRIEGGLLGIREGSETLLHESVDLLSLYHESLQ